MSKKEIFILILLIGVSPLAFLLMPFISIGIIAGALILLIASLVRTHGSKT